MTTKKVNKAAALLLALVMVFCFIPPSFAAVPAAPTNLTATAGDGSVVLNWTAATGAVSYNVYMGASTGAYGTTPAATGVTANVYRVTGLIDGTPYFFAVTAIYADGESGFSNEASATPASGATYASPTITKPSVNKDGTGLVSFFLSNATADWASNVTGVKVDGTPLTGQHSATTSAIQIDSTAFHKNARDTYNLVVSAAGYADMSAAVTVNNLGAKTLQIRIVGNDGMPHLIKTFSMDEIVAMEQPNDAYYNSICSMAGLRTFMAKGALFTDILKSAGVNFGPGMSLKLRTNDMAGANDSAEENAYYKPPTPSGGVFTYDFLMGQSRYYFPDIYTNPALKATLLSAGKFDDTVKTSLAASTKIPVMPMLAPQYIEKVYRSDSTAPDGQYSPLITDEMAFRFLFGIALNTTDPTRIASDTTTWDVAYDTFGIDIIDPEYTGDTPKTPPALTADATDNAIGQPVDLTFTDDLEWRGAVTGVKVNGTPVTGYTLNASTLTIPASAFTAAGSYAVNVSAAGYADDQVAQDMVMRPQITGYTISPNHGGTVFYPTGSTTGTDDQYETLVVQFDQPIEILNANNDNVINDDLDIELNGSGRITATNATDLSTPSSKGYMPYATVVAGSDGKSLVFEIHIGFAMYAGHLTVNASSNGIHNIVAADGATPVNWTNLACYIPNGVQLKTLSQTVGNTATGAPASVTIQTVTPSNSLRCMVHVLLLKNGVTVAPDANGASVECHYHDYLGMDAPAANGPATYATLVKGFFTSTMYPAIAPNYTTVANGDEVTVTENTPGDGDVLDLLVWAYPNDRPTGADKTALEAAIAEATPYPALKDDVAIANAVDTCVYYPQSAVDNETQELTDKINIPTSVSVTGVALDKQTDAITAGGCDQLTDTILPSNATNKSVAWSSDNGSVATVDQTGLVKAIASGSANITVRTTDGGFTAICAVTANAAQTTPTTLSANSPTVQVSSTAPVQVTVPSTVNNATLTTTPTVSGGNATVILPQVTANITTSQGNTVQVNIPNGTTVTGSSSSWDGTAINLPQVTSATVSVSGYNTSVSEAIEIGGGSASLALSQPVELILAGQGEKLAGYISNGSFKAIPRFPSGEEPATATEASTDISNLTPASNDGCYTDSSNNLVIWTEHFTTFVAYTETELNSGGGGGGGTVSYTPAVKTGAATSITDGSAVLNGSITSNNGYEVTGYGFLWGTSSGNLTNKLDVGTNNQSGAFTAALSSLTAGTTYYFEAYATNSQGTADGTPMSFTTTSAAPNTAPNTTLAFSDVSSSFWGYDAISSLSGKGVVGGYPDGTFKPDTSITRAEFATMLAKALGLNTAGTTGNFTDVKTGSWYYGAVNAAAAAGLVSGTGGGLFAPGARSTREQMAVMVAKALGTKTVTVDGTELNAFSDKPAVSSWAVSGMEEAAKAGIVSGMTADTLAPMENSTRAQAAAMIYKLLGIAGK